MISLLVLAALPQAPGPGPAPYWQQRVVYQITARLDEPTATLSGDEQVLYINHSPDTLRQISFHLYLNAFRPGSRWSDADSMERRRRFNDLKDPDFGFNHVRDVKIDGTPVTPIWPFGRDSTVVRFMLPGALPPGDSMTVTMNWDARPSTVPRRQGRRGRHYDFAQWYPKVVVYDKYGWEEHALYPAGEFYGEFGDFFVKLDVPEDQVIGATGAPVCGDPGWAAANQDASRPVGRDRDWDGETDFLPVDIPGEPAMCGAHGTTLRAAIQAANGRKELLWVARNVHNFAITMSPDYRYDGGEWNGIQVHVLYQPGDEKTWGDGIVVNETINTLRWLDFIFGKYPWPQMTVAHRIEGGGTEFPMMQMDGSASQGLNLHEGGHSYLMGILANNEWREGWMDEGFTSFQTTWAEEVQARNDGAERNLEAGILLSDLDGESEPVSTVSEKFRDFATYNNMIYNRGEVFLNELHRMVGDSLMLAILHRYYDHWKLHHVDEDAFRAVAEDVTHRDLKPFFAQWLHAVVLTDYAIHSASRRKAATGWQTTIVVDRKAPGVYPVTIAVEADRDTAYTSIDGIGDQERVTVATRSRPRHVMIDPLVESHDWNMLNNRGSFHALFGWFGRDQPKQTYLDTWFSQERSRSLLTMGVSPTVWYNDEGGATIGVRTRTDYLGRFEDNTAWLFCGTRDFGSPHAVSTCGFDLRIGSPVAWRAPEVRQQITAFRFEGRAGAGLSAERTHSPHLGFGPTYTTGASVQWVATYDMAYLPITLWDDGGSAEAALNWQVRDTRGGWQLRAGAVAAGGVMYRLPGGGITTVHRYDAQAYARPSIEATASRTMTGSIGFAVRGFVAGVFSADPVLSQRRFFVAGADPYQTLGNPLLRSAGAPLLRDDCWCRWQTPGGGDLRGYDESLSTDRIVAMNVELAATAWRSGPVWLRRGDVALFADGGYLGSSRGIGGVGDTTGLPPARRWLADAGVGIRLTQRIGQTTWQSRIDFPLFVSDPAYAIGHHSAQLGLDRLVFAISPVIR
ncbi:MAG: M1 family aminopeptidase [Gemmatimonadales bacterium]